jgi:superfamily II DNA helicase RecQ
MADKLAIMQTYTPEKISEILVFLQKGKEANQKLLSQIQECKNDDDLAIVNDRLVKVRTNYEKMKARRMEFTEPIKQAITELMTFENAYNPDGKDNEYTKARAVIETYNQLKLTEANKAKYVAEQLKKKDQYKANLKAAVARQVADTISGQHKNVIQGMVAWESSITLENFEQKEASLRASNPKLKLEKYDECFRQPPSDPIMDGKEALEFVMSLKKEFTYEKANEEFVVLVSPLKNEYVAKCPDIKKRLEELKAMGEKKAKEQAEKQKEELEKKAQEDLKKVDDDRKQKDLQIEDQKQLDVIESEFREQGMTQGFETGPTKQEVKLGEHPVSQFIQIVNACLMDPKFKGFIDKDGGYVKHVQWWLTFFGNNCDVKSVKGLIVEEKAKTIIRK